MGGYFMYIFQNALKNIARNKGRNILLGIMLLAIIATTVISLIINNTSNAIIDDYKDRFGAEAVLQIDQRKQAELMGSGQTIHLPPELHLNLVQSDFLKEARIHAELMCISNSILFYGQNRSGASSSYTQRDLGENNTDPSMKLMGAENPESLPEFKKGERQIIDGDRAWKNQTQG